jgi:hypothetical protein
MDRLQSPAYELVVEGESYSSARNPARKAGPSDFVGLTSSPLVGHQHHTARDRKQPVPYS